MRFRCSRRHCASVQGLTRRITGKATHRGSPQVEQDADLRERFGNHTVVRPLSSLLTRDQPGVHELFHVVTDRGLADAQLFREVAGADTVATLGRQVGQQPQTHGIREGLEHTGYSLSLLGA